jgi:hypothetical protein
MHVKMEFSDTNPMLAACAYGPTLAWGSTVSGHITKFPLTSRNFRENTKNFSGHQNFSKIFKFCVAFCPTVKILGGTIRLWLAAM